MFSKRTEPRAIAAQLQWFFTIAAVLLLSCGLGIFYWMAVRHAFTEDNNVLMDKLAAVSGAVQRAEDLRTLTDQMRTTRPGEPAILWIRLLSPSGDVVAENPGMNRLLPPGLFPAPPVPGSLGQQIRDYRSGPRLFALVSDRVENQGQLYTVEVAQDRSEDEEFRRHFGILFLVVLACGVVASISIARTVTRRGLHPIAAMTRTVQRIGPARLNERIDPARWPRELQPLAAAFDDMLARLEESFSRLSQFSADLAHELRTPVSNILGEAQVTLSRARDAEEYRTSIESTVAECERLSAIVDNLLFVARADGTERQISRSPLAALPAVEKIVSYYETLAEEKDVKITCRGDAQVFADPMLFSRALTNLIENALKFTPRGGTIEVAVSNVEDTTMIEVTDTGIGIPAEHLPRVFDRFYRVDPSRGSDGAGLGLALVKSILELHGGSVSIASEPDRGTTIRVLFPVQPTPA